MLVIWTLPKKTHRHSHASEKSLGKIKKTDQCSNGQSQWQCLWRCTDKIVLLFSTPLGIAMAIMFVIYNLYVYVYVHVQEITILVTIYKVSLL